jgi:hypothetical protein
MIIAILVTGCTSVRDWRRFGYVQGLEPTLDASQAAASAKNEENVLLNLAKDANLRPANDDLADIQGQEWGLVTESGFNLVNTQCEKYIDALFWWNRYKRTTVTELSLVGAATAAILGIANASAAAIAITAAAFGLTTATVENIGNSVLYELEPSGVKTIVDRAMATYRGGVSLDEINDRPTAVAVIQGYLALCLPASIETRVNEAIIDTDFVAAQDTESPVPELRRVSVTQRAGVTAEEVARESLPTPDEPLAPTALALTGIGNPMTAHEQRLSRSDGERIQRALCVNADGNFGQQNSETRKGIGLFQAWISSDPDDRTGQLDNQNQVNSLLAAPPCTDPPHRNAYEKFEYGSEEKIKDLQGRLGLEPREITGKWDDTTRNAIRAFTRGQTDVLTPELDNEIGTR